MSELSSDETLINGSIQTDEELELETFVNPLLLDESTLHRLAWEFSKVYRQLALESHEQFLPTPVTSLPTGDETGQYLAIDVGGTNLRVAFVELLGDGEQNGHLLTEVERSNHAIKHARRPRVKRTLEKAWPIGEHLKVDKTEDLFAWIGDCIAEVVGDWLSTDDRKVSLPDELDIGITFSFPMRQTALGAATLMPMGKGFTLTAEMDLGSTLLQGYERHTRQQNGSDSSPRSKRRRLGSLPKLRIVAITNDTIATLCSLAYSVKSLPNSRVAAGLIVGTGCNATIPMKLSDLGEDKAAQIRQFEPDAIESIINTEMTIAGACQPLKAVTTEWDRQLDAACSRPGFQPLEYMTGGRYVGELVRVVFFDYMTRVHKPPVPTASLPATIVHPYTFTTTFVSSVVARSRSASDLAAELKRRIPPPESSNWSWSPHSAGALRKIAYLVQLRSAGLIAAATVGLLATLGEISLAEPNASAQRPQESLDATETTSSHKANRLEAPSRTDQDGLSPGPGVLWHSGPEEVVVAYTGGIIQNYPNFKEQCQRFIDRLVMKAGPQAGGKSVFLREARDGGIIGAGVLAAMEGRKKR